VQPDTPATLTRLVATCLAKDPDARWQTARDLMRELTWIRDGDVVSGAARPRQARSRMRGVLALAAVAAIAAIAMLVRLAIDASMGRAASP